MIKLYDTKPINPYYCEDINVIKKGRYFTENPIKQKNIILNYMKNAEIVAFTTACVKDLFTNAEIENLLNNPHSDGVYSWYEDEIYHFEKYNLKLSDEFINHVMKQAKE